MRFQYLFPHVDGKRWVWRTWNVHMRQWWPFALGLRDHVASAYAVGWRLYGERLGRGR